MEKWDGVIQKMGYFFSGLFPKVGNIMFLYNFFTSELTSVDSVRSLPVYRVKLEGLILLHFHKTKHTYNVFLESSILSLHVTNNTKM